MVTIDYQLSQAEILRSLLDKADIQGYLTAEDIIDAAPQGDSMRNQYTRLLNQLHSLGIDVLETEDLADGQEISIEGAFSESDLPIGLEQIPIEDTVEIYLKEMSRVPLLSYDEEVSLARRIQKARAARLELAALLVRDNSEKRRSLEDIIEDSRLASEHITDTGGAASSTAIRALIKQLVASEDGHRPLSDAKIAEILGEQGIVVARRTVAKYRESLNIPPVNLRKNR